MHAGATQAYMNKSGYRVSELETTNSAGNAQSMTHTHKDPN